ncbi:hypothetical protein A1O3_07275 [Capronia epimyces CBS 606.96]|uniref:BTB domain-containing protein n=1 Tax=Capronia epimyces CBS 606.96 TaxID=1182542 RepID=W9XKF0_9EURO|nr:uncharacterized protein A1O3_07275 [Capronia epimyces CBS 606.96]EXJ80987.1 hypothetical protein A1O3_07275 [Capronia epimyces CBS 606.96]
MATLRELFTTAEGCDLIIICQGEFFFVHKAVIGPQSAVLKTEACNSSFLNGEAYLVDDDVPLTVFRKILAFLYCGDISGFPELLRPAGPQWLPPPLEYFARTFPHTDRFLRTVIGKPIAKTDNGLPSAELDMISNTRKWSVLTEKQRVMKDLYDEKSCNSPTEVSQELDIFAAAQQLKITSLEALAMKKVLAWFEKELQLGRPLSEDLHKIADLVLRKEKAFVKPFFSLYAKFFPALGMDLSLSRLMKDLDRTTFDLFAQLHPNWITERNRLNETNEQNRQRAKALEGEIELLKGQCTSSENTYKKDMETVKEALKTAQVNEIASAAKAELLERLNKSLQMDLLMAKVSNLKTKESNLPKADNQPKIDTAAEDAEKLKKQLIDVQLALKQHKADHQKLKNALKKEKEKLKDQLDDLKYAFKQFVADVNESGRCAGCKREWNFTLGHDHYTAINISCKLCRKDAWYY